ncbi:MAG: 50S ribosomal protein L3 [Candidatus Brocadiaceae bacterium]|nr:50S ribosomal protein L3 [Candidatus Brocadiaceae bacterium]
MTQIYADDGNLLPVTLIQCGPCSVLQIKTVENEGYSAVQLGLDIKRKKHATKPQIGHANKAKLEPVRFVREVNSEPDKAVTIGQSVAVEIFDDIEKVNVIGVTKGKGFAGVMKRWHMRGGPGTHGSTRHRSPGSVGAGTDPGRVIRGKRMPGRLGGNRVTIKNLRVVKIDKERNLLFVKGAVPGCKGSYLVLKKVC